MHPTNATLASREWVYTALTRAREKVVLTGNWSVYTKAIDNPRIEGDTLEAKIKFFTSGEYIKPIDLSKLA
jgi:ATP-dependent exoDNAse (exonuclease V) alpha subunit